MNNKLALFLEQKLLSQNNNLSSQQSSNILNDERLNKINYYCEWLDSLEVDSIMVFSSPSLDMLYLCYALVLKNKTYIPVHTSTAPELLISYLSIFSVDLLIVGDELIEPFNSEFKNKLHKEKSSTFFYYQTAPSQNQFCWLPGIVFFTSGTTELPKAVHYHYDVINHYLSWCIQEFNLTSEDHFLFTSELSFVASLRPLFIPLLAGSKISFIGAHTNKISLILNCLTQKQVTILNMTPTLFKILLEHTKQSGLQNQLNNVRLILLSGEPLDDKTINYWFKNINLSTVFYNLYGATEFLVPFYKRITQTLTEDERLHLGQLRLGCQYKLMFEKEKGYELYIAGDIATGYFDMKHTQESYFLMDDKRFIKTNDCVILIQGQLYYHTRNNRIIKRYGQIINLDQIEYLLRKNKPLCNFITLANEQQENEIHLFIENNQHDNGLLSAIKLVLKQHLPSYMHPNNYHFIEELPRTKSGKIDYFLLKQIATTENLSNLSDYFKKFFINQEVDNDALLISLGLESIDYIELSSLLLNKTGKWLDISQINETTRIADLPSYLIPLNFKKTKPKLVVKLHPGVEFFFLKQKREIYLISTFGLDNAIDLDRLELAISQTIDQHFMLSCKLVCINEEYFFERTQPQTDFWLKTPGLFKKNRPKLEALTHSERLIYIYLQKKNNQNFLIITFNHIALDGWSALLVREEIFRRYEGWSETKLLNNEEIESLNKINEIWLPPLNSLHELEKELISINAQEYNQKNCLFDGDLVAQNTCFLIPKEKMEKFISRNRLNNFPFSVLFALVMNQAVLQLINNQKLMFYVTLSDRNLPIEHVEYLIANLATNLPIFLNSENKTLIERARELQKLFTLYFKNMSYSAISAIWEKQIIDRDYLLFTDNPYPIVYTYINKMSEQEYIQNKYIDWTSSINELHFGIDLGIFLRVYNLGSQFVVILNTTMNKGLHEKILNYMKKIF